MKKDSWLGVKHQLLIGINFVNFLVGWGRDSLGKNNQSQQGHAYGVNYDQNGGSVSVKQQIITLINATRTLMRSTQNRHLITFIIPSPCSPFSIDKHYCNFIFNCFGLNE